MSNTTNVAHLLNILINGAGARVTMHRLGTDGEGGVVYAPVPGYEPSGHCYYNADGDIVVPAGEQLDMREDA